MADPIWFHCYGGRSAVPIDQQCLKSRKISLIGVLEQAFGRQWAWQLSMAAIFSARPGAACLAGQQSLGHSLLGWTREVWVGQVPGVRGSIPGQRHPFVVESGKKVKFVAKTFLELTTEQTNILIIPQISAMMACRSKSKLLWSKPILARSF